MSLPEDLIYRILAFLDGALLARCSCTCHAMKRLADEGLWAACVTTKFGWLVGSCHADARALFARMSDPTPKFVVVGVPSFLGAVGGMDGPQGAAYSYCPSSRAWAPFGLNLSPRNMPAVLRDRGGGLVVIGGTAFPSEAPTSHTYTTLHSVERFDGKHWRPLPPLQTARCCAGAASASEGRIFCVGGGESMYAASRAFATVEFLEADTCLGHTPELQPWKFAPSMLDARCAHGCTIAHATGHLYAVGGYGGEQRYLDTAERLHLAGGGERWEPLPRLSCRRAGCTAAVGPDGRIYCVGGGPDGRTEHKSMEAYDARMCSWDTSLPSMSVGRHYNAAAWGPDGRLYVSGTYRHYGQLDVVEAFDLRAGRWETLPQIGVVLQFSAGAFIF